MPDGRVPDVGEVYRQPLTLKILPLRKDAPIHLAKDAWPPFDDDAPSAVSLQRVDVIEPIEAQMKVSK